MAGEPGGFSALWRHSRRHPAPLAHPKKEPERRSQLPRRALLAAGWASPAAANEGRQTRRAGFQAFRRPSHVGNGVNSTRRVDRAVPPQTTAAGSGVENRMEQAGCAAAGVLRLLRPLWCAFLPCLLPAACCLHGRSHLFWRGCRVVSALKEACCWTRGANQSILKMKSDQYIQQFLSVDMAHPS